jgi:hypothetical protein
MGVSKKLKDHPAFALPQRGLISILDITQGMSSHTGALATLR